MKKIFLSLTLLLGSTIYAQANKEDVKNFIEISGMSSRYDNLINSVSKQVSPSRQEDFKKDMITFKTKMVNEMVNHYAAKFSQDEIEALLEIYQSILGKKLVAANKEFSLNYAHREQEFQREISRLILKYMY